MCFQKSWRVFKYRPKFHLGCHIVRSLKIGEYACINPVCFLQACLDVVKETYSML